MAENKKLIKRILAVVGVVLLVAVLVAVLVGVYMYFTTRPETEEGTKAFTVVVVHSDGETKTFKYRTDEEYLGKVLTEEGLISIADNGVYDTVDGEKANWEPDMAYWAFYIGEEYATVGPKEAPIHDGDTFKFVYTVSTGEW